MAKGGIINHQQILTCVWREDMWVSAATEVLVHGLPMDQLLMNWFKGLRLQDWCRKYLEYIVIPVTAR